MAIEQHLNAMCNLCRALTTRYHMGEEAFGGIRRNPQFVFGIFEERESEEVYEALIDASIEQERRAALDGL